MINPAWADEAKYMKEITLPKYSWVPNKRVYSFIWHQRNMKKETETKADKSI